MNRRKWLTGVLMVFLFTALSGWAVAFDKQQSAEELYEAAIFKKDADGDLEGAIEIFREILNRFPNNVAVAGKAQLQIGLCYEKMGREEAIKAYELVLKNYADLPELVAAARERIAALQMAEPKGLSVVKIPRSVEYPNYSRDGSKVVGNIWTIPGQNIGFYDYSKETLTPITRFDWEEGITYWAVFSPDAEEVAYWFNPSGDSKLNELRVSTLDGKSRILCQNTTGTIRPCGWLPDGSAVLAFARDENQSWRLGLVPAQGGEFRALRNVGTNEIAASVSPDGRYIVYDVFGPQGKRDIEVMTAEGKPVGVLTDHPADDWNALWSLDGNHVVFKSDRQGGAGLWGVEVKDGRPESAPVLIKTGMESTDLVNWTSQGLACKTTIIGRDVFVMPIDPDTLKPSAEANMVDFTPTGDNMQPVWSPDGKYLAFLSFRDKASIVLLPASGGKAKEYLVPFDNFWGIAKWWLMHLQWLPDSSGIGFKTMWPLPGEEEPTLICLDLASGNWKRWHVPVSWNGSWSRDGKSYIYEKHSSSGEELGLVIRDLSTGEERFIYRRPEGTQERIIFRALKPSLDFKKLIFQRTGVGWMELDIETEEIRVIGRVGMGNATWSPDGLNILGIDSPGDVLPRLCVMAERGGEKHYLELGGNLPQNYELYRPDWSPDGKKIAFQTRTWFTENYFLQNLFPKK